MAEPDFNIGPKPIDIGSLINMARGAQRLGAESQMGDIYGGATGPDGTIDPSKLGAAANMRRAGVYAPQLAQQAQGLTQGQNIIDKQKLDNTRSWWQVQDSAMYPLLNDPDLSHDKVLDAIHGLVGHQNSALKGGMFTPQMAIDMMLKLRGPDGKPLPPDGLRKVIGQNHTRVMDALQNSEYVQTGVFPPGHPYEGRPIYNTRAGAVVSNVGDINAAAAAAGVGPGGTRGGPAGPSGGAYSAPPHMMPPGGANAPAQGAPAAPRVAPGAVSMDAPMGLEERAKASGGLVAREYEDAANYRRQVMPLEQAIPALSKLGTTGTGPGTDEVNKIKSFLQSAGAGQLLGIDPDKIKNFDEAKKYLTDWVMATGSTGTNDKLAAAFASNANVGISNAAAKDVAKTALALRRMKHAQVAEFAQTGLPDGEYSRWALKFNREQDPRAYGFDLMTRDAAGKFLKSMSAEDRKRFDASLAVAERNGLNSPRGGWNAE